MTEEAFEHSNLEEGSEILLSNPEIIFDDNGSKVSKGKVYKIQKIENGYAYVLDDVNQELWELWPHEFEPA